MKVGAFAIWYTGAICTLLNMDIQDSTLESGSNLEVERRDYPSM